MHKKKLKLKRNLVLKSVGSNERTHTTNHDERSGLNIKNVRRAKKKCRQK